MPIFPAAQQLICARPTPVVQVEISWWADIYFKSSFLSLGVPTNLQCVRWLSSARRPSGFAMREVAVFR